MHRIKARSVLDLLKQISSSLDGEFKLDFSCASLSVNNEKAKGEINAYELFPGLAALIYNVHFHEDLVLRIDEQFMNPLYFIFCLNGKIRHRFTQDKNYRDIHFQQNVILSGSKQSNDDNIFYFPKGQKVECSFIYLLREIDLESEGEHKYLRKGVEEVLAEIGNIDTYEFFGQIRPKTAIFVERIIHNERKGVVARLLIEAAIMNILALQIEDHENELKSPTINAPLKQVELKRILKLSEYITLNLDKAISVHDLSRVSSLNQKKLQAGYRYLFGVSVNAYIKNVRLEKALELIQTTDLSISEIVYRIGLTSRSYFTRIFKDRYGYKPSEYRNMIKSVQLDILQ